MAMGLWFVVKPLFLTERIKKTGVLIQISIQKNSNRG